MAQAEIETRSPEQMLKDAYNRCIACGEYFTKDWPKIVYDVTKTYVFAHEKKAHYKYRRSITLREVGFEQHIFRRVSDDAVLVMTKYGERPEEVTN